MMREDLPEFSSERDLERWFEDVDLDEYDLVEALDVVVAERVQLTLEGAWAGAFTSHTTASGTTGNIAADPRLVDTAV